MREQPVFARTRPRRSSTAQNEDDGIDTATLGRMLSRVRPYACPELTLYDFRRGAAAILDLYDVAVNNARRHMGHATTSTTRDEAYLPGDAQHDTMGLLVNGKEDREVISNRGLSDMPVCELLTDRDEAEIRKDPRWVDAVEKRVSRRKASSPSSSSR